MEFLFHDDNAVGMLWHFLEHKEEFNDDDLKLACIACGQYFLNQKHEESETKFLFEFANKHSTAATYITNVQQRIMKAIHTPITLPRNKTGPSDKMLLLAAKRLKDKVTKTFIPIREEHNRLMELVNYTKEAQTECKQGRTLDKDKFGIKMYSAPHKHEFMKLIEELMNHLK